MLEKIRVAVDRETESILDRITQGIEDCLNERPGWSNDLVTDLRDTVRELLLAKPDWVAPLQESLLSSEKQNFELISKELQEIKSAGIDSEEQFEKSRQAFAALSAELQKIQSSIDLVKNSSRESSEATNALIRDVSSALAVVVQETAHLEAERSRVLAEQQQMISFMYNTLKKQSIQMTDLQISMNQVARPWWEKIFGGKK